MRQDDSGRVPACEVLAMTPSVRELIRDGHTSQLPSALHDGAMYGMQTFTQALYKLYSENEITYEAALAHADSPNDLRLMIKLGSDSNEDPLASGDALSLEEEESALNYRR